MDQLNVGAGLAAGERHAQRVEDEVVACSPGALTVQAAGVCGSPRASSQVWATARVGPLVLAVDVSADHLPGLVEGLELV